MPIEDLNTLPENILISFYKDYYGQTDLLLHASSLLKENYEGLVRFFLSECKKITRKELLEITDLINKYIDIDNGPFIDNWQPPNIDLTRIKFLGEFIEYGVSIDYIQNEIFECFAKSYVPNRGINYVLNKIIRNNNKYSKAFIDKVKSCFFDKYEDEYALALSSVLFEIGSYTIKTDIESFFESIQNDILSKNKETICMAILKLTTVYSYTVYFGNSKYSFTNLEIVLKNIIEKIEKVYELLWDTISFDDPHYFIIITLTYCHNIIDLGERIENCRRFAYEDYGIIYKHARFMELNFHKKYILLIIKGWLTYKQYSLRYISAHALIDILKPDFKFDLKNDIPELENAIKQKYQEPQNMYDKLVATYLGIIIDVPLGDDYERIKVSFNKRAELKN